MQKQTWWVPVLVLSASLGVGCGDDSGGSKHMKDSGPPPALDSGMMGDAGMVKDSGAVVVSPGQCGTVTCAAPADPLMAFRTILMQTSPVACCLDKATETCGLAPSAGATCEAPAVADTTCPSIDLGAIAGIVGGALPGAFGCCTKEGKCGVEGGIFGRGCVENSEAATLVSGIPLVGGFLMIPAPVVCGLLTDGGAEDAGSAN